MSYLQESHDTMSPLIRGPTNHHLETTLGN